MNRLGQRIKRKRESLHLQLNDLAKKVGITPSALSQIENAKAFPSIVTLKTIADCLHVTVGELIGEYENTDSKPIVIDEDKIFVKRNESGSELYLLSHPDITKTMDTYKIRLLERSDTDNIFERRNRQEFCHVTKGAIEFVLEDILYELKAGDSVYFNAQDRPHAVNVKEEVAEMVWITPHI